MGLGRKEGARHECVYVCACRIWIWCMCMCSVTFHVSLPSWGGALTAATHLPAPSAPVCASLTRGHAACNPTLACCATPPWRAVHSEAFYAANVHGGVDAEVFRRLLPEGSTDAEIAEMSARKVPPHA